MRAATITMMLGAAALALPACNKAQPPRDQNIVMDNGTLENADIEALPPDESSGTSSNELVNGTDNPDVNELNLAGNGY